MPRCPECLKKDPDSHAELYGLYEGNGWWCPTCHTRFGYDRKPKTKQND